MDDLIWDLYIHGVICLEKHTFKSGVEHPIYVDMRQIIVFPHLLKRLALLYSERVGGDFVVGVPLGGLHLATAVSLNLNKPMLLVRNQRKKHGAKNLIEGKFRSGQTVSLLEDIVTSGKSVRNVMHRLIKEELEVVETVCFLAYFPEKTPHVKPLTTLEAILRVLFVRGAITKDLRFKILQSFRFLSPACLFLYPPPLKGLVKRKKSQLIIALDETWPTVKKLIPILAPYVCAFKFHYDILYQTGYGDFEPWKLMAFAKQYNFLVIRDRKYADVCKTNNLIAGPEGRNQHVNIVHMISGISALPSGPIIIVLDMSTTDNLFTPNYIESVINQTQDLPNVLGYISQHKWWSSTKKLCFTPGINLENDHIESKTAQIYSTPERKREDGADLFIVGSAIVKSKDPIVEAKKFQDATWNPEIEKLGTYCYNRLLKYSSGERLLNRTKKNEVSKDHFNSI